jgi:hypothetical protein
MFVSKLFAMAGVAGLTIASLGMPTQAAEVTEKLRPAPHGAVRSQPLPESIRPADSPPPEAISQTLDCPPGQFPSAFRDVYPFHWAYTAVNNLASERMQCFDLPEEFR